MSRQMSTWSRSRDSHSSRKSIPFQPFTGPTRVTRIRATLVFAIGNNASIILRGTQHDYAPQDQSGADQLQRVQHFTENKVGDNGGGHRLERRKNAGNAGGEVAETDGVRCKAAERRDEREKCQSRPAIQREI